MAHLRLFLASLVVVLSITASSASAAACPPKQTYTGTLTPGSDASIAFTLPVRSQWTVVQFIPDLCQTTTDNEYTLRVLGGSMAGDCSVAVWLGRAPAGSYVAQVSGSSAGMENMATMTFRLTVSQSSC